MTSAQLWRRWAEGGGVSTVQVSTAGQRTRLPSFASPAVAPVCSVATSPTLQRRRRTHDQSQGLECAQCVRLRVPVAVSTRAGVARERAHALHARRRARRCRPCGSRSPTTAVIAGALGSRRLPDGRGAVPEALALATQRGQLAAPISRCGAPHPVSSSFQCAVSNRPSGLSPAYCGRARCLAHNQILILSARLISGLGMQGLRGSGGNLIQCETGICGLSSDRLHAWHPMCGAGQRAGARHGQRRERLPRCNGPQEKMT